MKFKISCFLNGDLSVNHREFIGFHGDLITKHDSQWIGFWENLQETGFFKNTHPLISLRFPKHITIKP